MICYPPDPDPELRAILPAAWMTGKIQRGT